MNEQPAPKITRQKVESSQIESIGHDPATSTLEIEFVSRRPGVPGSVYQYGNVSADLHAQLVGAESIGSFFGKEIKPHKDKYPFRKMEPEVVK